MLPRPYVARCDRYVWIDDPEDESSRPLGQPDTYVADMQNDKVEPGGPVATLVAPVMARMPVVDPKGKLFVKILDAHDRRVVTVVEMLSPANKSVGKDGDAYLAKRQEYLQARTNLVEIDLLRRGSRPPVQGQVPPADYYIIVCRGVDYPDAAVWPLTVRDPLPAIPIPLDPAVVPVMLDLRPCLDRAYDEGRLDEDIDYSRPPAPPLTESDAVWSRKLLDAKRMGTG
jgi:hypothetical protein